MPFDNIDYLSRPLYYTTNWIGEEPQMLKELRLNCSRERTEKKMEVRDKICDKCGKRYSVADMRKYDNGVYTDKECYLENNAPIDNYPKVYHSRIDEKYVGRVMDLCSDCAEELKKFVGEN